MNQDQEIENYELDDDAAAGSTATSVDDFIRQLEEKEKDLHISSDLSIEISNADFDDSNIPDFIKEELEKPPAPVAAKPQPAKAPDAKLSSEIKDLKSRITRLQAERVQILERSQQRLKEFENFKVRMERERRETFVSQVCNLATLMLPVLDNLDRALDSASALPEEIRMQFEQFFEGIVLVTQQVNEVLVGMGVQPISAVGQQFDPQFHEAVATDAAEGLEPNSVSEEFLRGYRMGNKVIRHSMVRVVTAGSAGPAEASGQHAADAAPPDEAAPAELAPNEFADELQDIPQLSEITNE